MLSEHAEELPRPGGRPPKLVWTPIATALIVLTPGVVGMLLGKPTLFPSLGPSALMQAHEPERPSSRPYNIIVSHSVGVACGFVAVVLFGIAREPSVFEVGTLGWNRVGAAVLAVTLGALIELAVNASHPPAASTTLLCALGSFKPTVEDTLTIAAGVVSLILVGELIRRVRLRQGKTKPATL